MQVARRARWARWLLALAPAAGAVELHADLAGLDEARAGRARALMHDVPARLPPRLVQALPERVDVHWVDDLPAHVAGRAFAGVIRVDRRLLDEGGEAQARATLLHELVHVADRGKAGGWSADARLREVAGWQQRPWKLGRTPNRFSSRSPDPYERESAAEYLAVNVEQWLQDPSFSCRRPTVVAWLTRTLGAPPGLAPARCDPQLPLLQAGEEEGAVRLRRLDPARVHAIDYLFAEGADAPMSRWGHSMLRVVVCREGRAPGPACRLDLDEHIVLSFRAFVGDVQLSNWRGLAGGYPSRLFVLPLQQVIDEYTRTEMRGLASTPLRLTAAERAGLLARAAQVHWSYDGRYYFIANNCAVETAKLLQGGVPALQAAGVERLTPQGLRRRLVRLDRLDMTVLQDRPAAVRDGYYFPAADTYHAQLFEVAAREASLPVTTAGDWLALDPSQRTPWLQRSGLRASAALLLLEQASQRQHELRARDRLKRMLVAGRGRGASQRLQQLLAASGQWLQPGAMLASGYGLPQDEELQLLQQQLDQLEGRGPAAWKALRADLRRSLPAAERAALDTVESNLLLLGARLRDQAAHAP